MYPEKPQDDTAVGFFDMATHLVIRWFGPEGHFKFQSNMIITSILLNLSRMHFRSH
jgi:hypothetical protein